MLDHAPAILFALFLWWFSTGAIFYVVGGRAPLGWSVLAAGIMAAAGVVVLALTADEASVTGAYLAFSAAVLVWGGIEVSFLTGLLTGPRKEPCPPGCTGWRRVARAVEAILYHELALVAAGLVLVAAAWGGANQVGPQTFLLLWAMRLSAKLNLFLGVPVTNEELLPERLRFLASFFARRPINALFPVSVTGATILTVLLFAGAGHASAFEATGLVLLATFAGLAVLEHWFMILPLPSAALWQWSLSSRVALPPAHGPLAADILTIVQPDQGPALDRRRS